MTAPARSDIEAILPLTPMQTALLFATLAAPGRADDPAFLQMMCTLRGILDEACFRAAWQHVINRHAALRTSVHWEETERPLQVVARSAELSFASEDWRGLPDDVLELRFASFLDDDRNRGLDPRRPPVMRIALLRTAEDTWRLVWSCHHLLLDGWSGALVLGEVAATCDALVSGRSPALPVAPQYRDFVGWLLKQDAAHAEEHWRESLAGLSAPTPLPFEQPRPPGPIGRRARAETVLEAHATRALLAFAREHHLTPGTLVQGAWALQLAGHAATNRVCFGTTLSGRAAPLPGIDAMVGVLSSTLPVCCGIDPAGTVVAFLHSLQQRLASLQVRAHDPADRIHEWSGVPGRQRLYDSLVVFENIPVDVLGGRRDSRLCWQDLSGGVTTGHALTLVAEPRECLVLKLLHDPLRFRTPDAQRLVDETRAILERLPAAAHAPARNLMPAPAPERTARDGDPSADDLLEPTTSLELRVWKLWEQVLDTRAFGIDDDFFALGGYSLLVARLLAVVEERLGVRVPVATFFRAPTVRALAREVERLQSAGEDTTRPSAIVLLAPGSEHDPRPPLFLLHGIEGDVVPSYNLVRYLAGGQRVWGVQMDDGIGTDPSFEDMAAYYARAIRTVEPDGPVSLVGNCMGGALAFETARQLSERGGAVASLTVIDADPYVPRWPRNTRLMYAWWNLQSTPRGQRAAAAGRKVRKAITLLFEGIRSRIASTGNDAATATERTTPARDADEAHIAAYERYRPHPWNGRVSVVLAGSGPPGLARWRRREWARLAREVEVHTVPGTHYTLMSEAHVRALADCVQTDLDAAAERVRHAKRMG